MNVISELQQNIRYQIQILFKEEYREELLKNDSSHFYF